MMRRSKDVGAGSGRRLAGSAGGCPAEFSASLSGKIRCERSCWHKTGGMHFEQTAQRQKPATTRKTMLRMARLSVLYTACSPNPEPWGTFFVLSTFLKLKKLA